MGKVFGTLGLLCGLFGIILSIMSWFAILGPIWGLILAALGLIFSIVGIVSDTSPGAGVVGLIFSIIGLIIAIAAYVAIPFINTIRNEITSWF
jgi:hypothetical protein